MIAPESRPGWLAVLDRLSVAACAIVWGMVILRIAPFYSAIDGVMAVLVGSIVGYLLADLVSGMVHWLADRYFDPRTPILGPALIAPFREHHADELAMTRHDFFEISGNNGLVTIPLALILLWLPPPMGLPMQCFMATVLSLGLSIIATNQFHCWAHAPHPPGFVRRLQRGGWILSPESHAIHHSDRHDRAYCVTSGWLNPILDRYRFFERLDGVIDAATRKSEGPRDP